MGQAKDKAREKYEREQSRKRLMRSLPMRIVKALVNVAVIVPTIFIFALSKGFEDNEWIWD